MHYDFVEIGCCDFGLYGAKQHERGIRVEPVKMYYDKLPKLPNVVNLRAVITDGSHEMVAINFVRQAFLKKYPDWMRGCNTIGKHPEWKNTPIHEIGSELVTRLNITCLINLFDITTVRLWKMDTEGCDEQNLIHLLGGTELRPDFIDIEYKYFKKPLTVDGYEEVVRGPSSMIIKRCFKGKVTIG